MLAQNWDKLLTVTLSVLVAGVVGFFAAIESVNKDIWSLKEEIATLKAQKGLYATKDDITITGKDIEQIKTRMSETLLPSLKQISEQGGRISAFEARLIKIEISTEFIKNQSDTILSNTLKTAR